MTTSRWRAVGSLLVGAGLALAPLALGRLGYGSWVLVVPPVVGGVIAALVSGRGRGGVGWASMLAGVLAGVIVGINVTRLAEDDWLFGDDAFVVYTGGGFVVFAVPATAGYGLTRFVMALWRGGRAMSGSRAKTRSREEQPPG